MAAIAIMASCAKENVETTDVWDGELRISSGIETRASGTMWDDGDAIGVFMNETDNYEPIGTHNTPYSTSLSAASATASFSVVSTTDAPFDPLYYPQSDKVDIMAHYPYNADATVVTYPIDVTTQTPSKNIDFMSAKMVGVEKSKDELKLEFFHLLSQLKITLAPADGGGLTTDDLASATVKVSGTQVTAEAKVGYDSTEGVPTATYTLSGEATDLSLVTSSSVATFILVPQTADVTITITVDKVGEFYVSVSSMALTSGDEHSYTISVSRTAAIISGAKINGWDEDGEVVDEGKLDASDYVEPEIDDRG